MELKKAAGVPRREGRAVAVGREEDKHIIAAGNVFHKVYDAFKTCVPAAEVMMATMSYVIKKILFCHNFFC